MAKQRIDPTCAFHCKKWSEHPYGRCLYCCLCFKTLLLFQCHVTEDGRPEDVCNQCATEERAIMEQRNAGEG